MELTKNLNLDATPLNAGLGDMTYAKNIIATAGNIINEPGFKKLITLTNKTIIGIISVPNGFVVFCKGTIMDSIMYFEDNDPDPKKVLESTYFKFSISRPIFGEYTYNYKKDLIVSFSEGNTSDANETRIVNINDYGDTQYSTLTSDQVALLNLIPDIKYPTLSFTVINEGSNKVGTYQVAIAYKLSDDTYSNFSILHKTIHIIPNTADDNEPGTSIAKSIEITANNIDSKYTSCKLGIVYKEETSELAYETSDILTSELNGYIITSVSSMTSISLDDIILNSISYIKDNAHCSFNANLIRGNVATVDYDGLDDIGATIADACKVTVTWIDLLNPLKYDLSNAKYFREDEMYALYLGLLDYKGNLVNAYPIHHKLGNDTIAASGINAHQIPQYSGEGSDGISINSGYASLEYDRVTDISTIDYNAINFSFNKPNGDIVSPGIDLFSEYGSSKVFDGSYITNPTSESIMVSFYTSFGINAFTDELDTAVVVLKMYKYDVTTKTIGELIISNTKAYTQGGSTHSFYNLITIEGDKSIAIFVGIYKTYNQTPAVIDEDDLITADTLINNATLVMTDNKVSTVLNKPAALLNVTLPSNIVTLLGTHSSTIKQCCVFYAEHNADNSKILSQAFATRDTHINNINDNYYHCAFKSHTKIRLYSFDYLFDKRTLSNADITSQYKLGGFSGTSNRETSKDLPTYDYTHLTKIFSEPNYTTKTTATVTPTSIEYVDLDNSIQNNTASDSFYRPTLTNAQVNTLLGGSATKAEGSLAIDKIYTSDNFWHNNGWGGGPYPNDVAGYNEPEGRDIIKYRFALVNLVNRSTNLYSNLYNQTLVVASSIVNLTPNTVISCTGDTFYGNFTFRMTAPHTNYFYGNSDGTRDGNVFKIIISIAIESRYNIQGRYSGSNAYQKVYNIGTPTTSNQSDRDSFFAISYKYDNFINTSEGRGYSAALHENGLAVNTYVKELTGIATLMNRVIRSNANSSESLTLGWRYYATTNYKDLPLQRGGIQALSATDRYLYIQQQYGLRISSVQDKLSAESTTTLGSSDLFDREPVEVLYDKFGYISCANKFGTALTPIGYVVVDPLKAKIFLVNGLESIELTKDLVKDWFVYNINNTDVASDNPFTSDGIHITYEDIYKRLIFTYKSSNTDKRITLSYSLLRGGFVCFHDYNGDFSFYNNLGTYQLKDNTIFKMNHTNKATYFDGVVKESIVRLIWNPESTISKLLQEVEWQTLINTIDANGTLYHYNATISKLMLHTDTQCTGIVDVNDNLDWFDASSGTLKSGKWFFNNIGDIVINDYLPFIKNFNDLQLSNLSNSKEWFDISKFICTFVYVTIIYDNYYYDSADRDWYASNNTLLTRKQGNFVLNNVNVKAIKDNR